MARHHKKPKSEYSPFKSDIKQEQNRNLIHNNLHSNTWRCFLALTIRIELANLCPCPLNLVDGMRIGSSSLSSESWLARAGWLWPSSPSFDVGSALLQPPDASSVPSGWLLSSGEEATAPPWLEPPAAAWADELPRALEQEASHGGSVETAGTLCCPEDPERAEGEYILIHKGLISNLLLWL